MTRKNLPVLTTAKRQGIPRSPRPANRRGAAIIEMAFVLPGLLLLILGIMEFGSIFFIHNNMLFAAREAVRAYAVGDVDSAGAEALANDKLPPYANLTYTVKASPDKATNRERWVEISCPMSQAAIVDPLGIVSGAQPLTVRVYMRQEN